MKTRAYLNLIALLVVTSLVAAVISCDKDKDAPAPPNGITNKIDIKTDSVTSILYRDAKVYSSIGDLKSLAISQYGHCWDTLEVPTIESSKTTFNNLSAQKTFASNLLNLKPNKKYYLRGYAKSSLGTVYGAISSFTTKTLEPPILKTDSTTIIASNSVTVWGTVSLDGGSAISARGVCWGVAANPTLIEQHAAAQSQGNTFSSSISGLTRNTTYHTRVYATNQSGTAYGNDMLFTTKAELPIVTTAEVSDIATLSATCGGNITDNGGVGITARGVCWSISANPTLSDPHTSDGTADGVFTSSITALQPGKAYFVRAYATNAAGTSYGNVVNFTTLVALPTVTTTAISTVSSSSVASGGNVIEDGGADVTARGVCWSTSASPTIADSKTSNGTGKGIFSSSITGLTAATTYYVRAYATNSAGTAYGSEISFSTTATIPTLTTVAATLITSTTAASGGSITTDGGAAVTSRGVCWSQTANPTIDLSTKTIDGAGVGSFTSSITGLNSLTTYHVRAYATSSLGTAYGADVTFTTTANLPVVTTTAISGITSNSANSGGNVTSDGGATVTARGVCWSTSANPTFSDSHTSNTSGTGVFTSSLAGLNPGTTYHVRAYATNSAGTSYGTDISFTTTVDLPTISTAIITNLTESSATAGGDIASDGGAPVTVRGVCWGTALNPTISGNHTSNGSGTGSFTSSLTGLIPATTYHVRAYASNAAGTAYGLDQTFTTSIGLPSVTTSAISNISGTSAFSGGNVTSDGGSSITARGLCWSTTSNPTLSDNHTTNGFGLGIFSGNITGLTANTTYYVRAYATNIVGIGYGNELTFTSLGANQISDIDGNTYNTVTIGSQVWMAVNLSTTKFRDGTPIAVGAYSWYNNDISNKVTYGALYNYYTVVDGHNLCPAGWHVPVDSEWELLTTLLGGESVAGGKLKEAGTAHWVDPNTSATNESGFSALPGGYRGNSGDCSSQGYLGTWWTATEYNGTLVSPIALSYDSPMVNRTLHEKTLGYSVRCIQGEMQSLPTISTDVVSSITSTSATSGGSVTSDGGATVTERGICWSISSKPDITGSHISSGSGVGAFTGDLTGLIPNTTYYVRSYAINSGGVAYGNEVTFKTSIAVGDAYQGGIVAYILQSGDQGYVIGEIHGLIAAPYDQSNSIQWYNGIYLTTDAKGTAVITSIGNTISIVDKQGSGNYAAKLCYDLELGGYNDWALPSIDALGKLYLNRAVIGGFSDNNYWSSTEYGNSEAMAKSFLSGSSFQGQKDFNWHVRAVRSF